MTRYLIQIDLARAEQVKTSLGGIGIRPISQMFDYISVDILDELVPKVRAIPGVISVMPDKRVEIKQIPIPIEKKIKEFHRLFWSNPLTGPFNAFRFSLQADTGKKRVPTSESRKMVGADIAEQEGITGKGIKIACLDTGTNYLGVQGPYLGGKSSVEGQIIPADENGHGTHTQSTISGRPFPSIHGLLKGVAVDAEVAAFKVLGYGLGAGTMSSILRGFMDAFEWGADVYSLSLGGAECEDYRTCPECRVVSMLTKEGKIICIAAGNSGPESHTLGCPGSAPDALTCGAVDIEGRIADFSSRGPSRDGRIKPDVVACGVNVLSTSAGLIALMQAMDGPPLLAAISGTSMSTPHVAGMAALALQYARSKGKKLTTDHIKEAMNLYGEFAGAKNPDYGWGLITYPILKRYIDEVLSA